MACIINQVVKALNEIGQNKRMPRFIIVIPDRDILRYINYLGFGISHLIGTCLESIIRKINNHIESRKDNLRKKKPGALRANEPKVIWTKTFTRPNMSGSLFSAVEKFNKILEEIMATHKNHLILDVNKKMEHASNFNRGSYLNNLGKDNFWLEVNRMIERYDYGKEELMPVANPEYVPTIPEQSRRPLTIHYKPAMKVDPTYLENQS